MDAVYFIAFYEMPCVKFSVIKIFAQLETEKLVRSFTDSSFVLQAKLIYGLTLLASA